MSYIYHLAGENLELAEAELEGFLGSQGVENKLVRKGRFAVTGSEPSQLKRLGLVHEVSEIVERKEFIDDLEYTPSGSFSVRAIGVEKEVEETAGAKLESGENRVELENPDEKLRLYNMEEEFVLGRLEEDIDRGLFEQRKNQHRPYSSPVSLDPVIARVLVNLSEVSAGGKILDPFCGTGGILIEAGLCGIKPYGLDIQQEMVEGTRDNLESLGILNHDIRQGEIAGVGEVFDRKFDAIVTDLPYGKASKTEGNPVEEFLEIAPELSEGKTVFMSDQEELGDLEPEFEIYEHKNLTRFVYII